jgi:hypothetical protein
MLVTATLACSDGPVAPKDITGTLSERLETQNVIFQYSPGDSVEPDWQQRFHDWISAQLEVTLPTKLRYYKYRDRSQILELTGWETNGLAEPEVYAVHSIFPSDGHEAIHVYSALVGRPSDFFNEGIAVALDSEPGALPLTPQWNGTHVYEHTLLLIRTNQLRPIRAMVTTDAFRDFEEWLAYGEAGSFLLYLIEEHGMDPLLGFFRSGGRNDSLGSIESKFRQAWGISLDDAEQQWLAHVAAWSG